MAKRKAPGKPVVRVKTDGHRLFVLEGHRIDAALQRGVDQAVLEHLREGLPMVVYRDGKVVWLSPDELNAEVAKSHRRQHRRRAVRVIPPEQVAAELRRK